MTRPGTKQSNGEVFSLTLPTVQRDDSPSTRGMQGLLSHRRSVRQGTRLPGDQRNPHQLTRLLRGVRRTWPNDGLFMGLLLAANTGCLCRNPIVIKIEAICLLLPESRPQSSTIISTSRVS